MYLGEVIEAVLVEAESCRNFLVIDLHVSQGGTIHAFFHYQAICLQAVGLYKFDEVFFVKLNTRPQTNFLEIANFADTMRRILALGHVAQCPVNVFPFVGQFVH